MSGKCEDSETWHRAALRTPVVPRRTFTLCSSLENVPEKCAVPGFVFCLSQRRSALCWEQALLSAGISVGPKPRGCEPPGYGAGGGEQGRGHSPPPQPPHSGHKGPGIENAYPFAFEDIVKEICL